MHPDDLIDDLIPFITAVILNISSIHALIAIIALIEATEELIIDGEATHMSDLIVPSPAPPSMIHRLVPLIAAIIPRISQIYALIAIISLIRTICCLIFDVYSTIVEVLVIVGHRWIPEAPPSMVKVRPAHVPLIVCLDDIPLRHVRLVCGSKRWRSCATKQQQREKDTTPIFFHAEIPPFLFYSGVTKRLCILVIFSSVPFFFQRCPFWYPP